MTISPKEHRRAKIVKEIDPTLRGNYARLRNGVETVPASPNHAYDVDRVQARWLAKKRIFFG